MTNQRRPIRRGEPERDTTRADAFGRIFGGAIAAEEVEAALRREAADEIRSLEGDRLLAPNEYVITLSVHEYQKVVTDPGITAESFAAHLAGYIGERGWQTYGEVVVRFEPSTSLHAGQFRTRGDVNADVSPDQNVIDIAAPQLKHHAFTAETGAAPMTDNPSYGQGPDEPGDETYDDRYPRPESDSQADQEPQPRGPYPPESSGYPPQPDQGYMPPPPPESGGYPDPGRIPSQGAAGYQPPYEPGYQSPYEQRPPTGYGSGPGYDAGYRSAPGGYGPPTAGPGYDDYGRGPARPEDAGYGPPEQQPSSPERGDFDQGYPGGAPYGPPNYGRYPDAPGGGYGYGQPPSDYGQPSGYDYGRPPSDYGRPAGYDYGQPSGYDYGQAPGGYSQPPGGYGQPPGGYSQPAGYGQPPGGYSQPAGYGQPPAGYGQPPGGYSQPGGYDEPGGSYSEANLGGYGEPGGGYGYGDPGGFSSTATGVVLQLDDGSGRTYELRDGANVVGRGQEAQFRLPDTGVSRRHLEIRWDGQVALLSDLNSTNGTTVNNAPVQEWQLADGDVVRLGHSEIIVRFH